MGEIKKYHRRSIRLPGYDYASLGDYFITIMKNHCRSFFGKIVSGEMQLSKFGEIAYNSWNAIPNHHSNVEIGTFVIMPNHVHGIITIVEDMGRGTACCAPTEDNTKFQDFGKLEPGSVSAIIRSFKSAVTNQIHRSAEGNPNHIWQRNYYESIITSDEDYARIAAYIEFNPENWPHDEANPDNVNGNPKLINKP